MIGGESGVAVFEISRAARRRSDLGDEIPAETPAEFDLFRDFMVSLRDPMELSPEERAGALRAAHQAQMQLEAYATAVAGAADVAKDSQLFCAGTTGTMVAALTRQNPPVGSGMVARARDLRDMPHTEAAYQKGLLSGRHVRILADAAKRLERFPELESALVTIATLIDPKALAAGLQDLIEQDRPEILDDDYEKARDKRTLSLSELLDGTWKLNATLDPVAGRRLRDALDMFTDRPSPEDPRTPKQRRADGMDDLVAAGMAHTSNGLGVSGVTITADIDTLADGIGARVDDMPIGPDLFDLLTCTGILSVILGKNRGKAYIPLMLGRTARRATPGQWAALIVRDGGCIKCGRDARFTEAHHIIHWRDGGLTDLSNLCLLCSRCHHDLHLGYFGVTMVDGLPQITLTPTRRP